MKKMPKSNNITLIGMSGVGKSTIGRELASQIGYDFIDTDILIKNEFNEPLQKILKEIGPEKFKEIEEKHIMSLAHVEKTVISPGGSVIYSDKSMQLLNQISKVFHLSIVPEILAYRVGGKARGIIGIEKKGFARLYKERIPLYEKYSDYNLDIHHKNLTKIINEIIDNID